MSEMTSSQPSFEAATPPEVRAFARDQGCMRLHYHAALDDGDGDVLDLALERLAKMA